MAFAFSETNANMQFCLKIFGTYIIRDISLKDKTEILGLRLLEYYFKIQNFFQFQSWVGHAQKDWEVMVLIFYLVLVCLIRFFNFVTIPLLPLFIHPSAIPSIHPSIHKHL